jgi:peptidoglycan/LPS O-acetylase OafA/YrhL
MGNILCMTEDPRERLNNFDLLRFLLAGTVVLFHVGVLSGSEPLRTALWFANGRYAVLGFFAISGYVVSLSWRRAGSVLVYFRRRARRVLPGYLAVVLFCWVVGAAVSRLPLLDYWGHPQTWRHLLANLTLLQFLAPALPGVFVGNPFTSAVNGSLWSIRAEIFCYALVPLLAARWRSVGLAVSGVAITMWLAQWQALPTWVNEVKIGLIEPIECFAVGAVFAQGLVRRAAGLGIAGALLAIFLNRLPSFAPLEPIAVAAAVLAFALALPYLGRWSALGNLSYGMYLWHFPLLQWLSSGDWAARSPWLFLAAAIVIILVFAALSWHLAEKRFLVRAPN